MEATVTETVAASTKCSESAWDKPEYGALRTKIYVGSDNNLPLEFTTNTGIPNKQEIGLLYKAHADQQACRKIALDGLAKAHPMLMLVLVENYSARDKLWAETAAGRLLGKVQPGYERRQ
jgi:hypothetical protein